MYSDIPSQPVEAARQQLTKIQQSINAILQTEAASTLAGPDTASMNGAATAPTILSFLSQTVADLSATVEELETAAEELSCQHEEWLAVFQETSSQGLQLTPDALVITDARGIIQEANGAAATLLNVRHDFLIGKPLRLYFAIAERRNIDSLLNQLASSTESLMSEERLLKNWEAQLQPRNGKSLTVALSVARIYNSQRLVGVRWRFEDRTQKKQREAELLHKALYDGLTNLANRSLFLDRLSHTLQLFRRYPKRLFAVLFIDINDFKQINDGFGHLVGDEILAQTAARLSQCIRETDTAARLGGDEFAILLEQVSSYRDAENCAKRILQALKNPVVIEEQTFLVCASIGITLASSHHQKPQDVLQEADRAMYQSKQERSSYQLFAT